MKSSFKRVDVGLIANPTSDANELELMAEMGKPENDFFLKPLPFSYKNIKGEVVPLKIKYNEILGIEGMRKAKTAMLTALKYLIQEGADVISFTASTKRLAGKCGEKVKSLYPNTIFTIGDNGTIISFFKLIKYSLSFVDAKNDIIVCMGAGLLGEQVIKYLLNVGGTRIFVISQQKLGSFYQKITAVKSLEELPANVKLFINCTHKYDIEPMVFKKIIAEKGIILDVAVPPINKEVFAVLPDNVLRFDAGNFFLKEIKYNFPPQLLRFPTKEIFYGCFAEGLMLVLALNDGADLKNYNFFQINRKNQNLIEGYLKAEEALIPLVNFFDEEKIKGFIHF